MDIWNRNQNFDNKGSSLRHWLNVLLIFLHSSVNVNKKSTHFIDTCYSALIVHFALLLSRTHLFKKGIFILSSYLSWFFFKPFLWDLHSSTKGFGLGVHVFHSTVLDSVSSFVADSQFHDKGLSRGINIDRNIRISARVLLWPLVAA